MTTTKDIGTHQTTLHYDDQTGEHVLVYHSTPVVKYDELRGVIRFNAGGWKSNTTKRRMNQFIAHFKLTSKIGSVVQLKGDWYLTHPGGDIQFEDDTLEVVL